MKLRYLIATCAALAVVSMPASASAASSGVFKVTASGKQSLTWSLNGTRGSCEIQTGNGSGSSGFSFKSSKAGFLTVSKASGILGSITTSAKGTRAGSFTETYTACPGFVPPPTFTADASGCGDFKTGIRMDFNTKNALTWVTGPASPLPGGICPIYGDFLFSNDLTACGDSNTQYKRSYGVSFNGAGLFASKLGISVKSLLKVKTGKKKTITGKSTVECKPQSTYSNPITLKGELKYSLVFKRTG